jgi:hypothetical protein
MSIDLQRVEKNIFGWSSIIYTVEGQEVYGCTSLSYGWKRERSDGYGLGRSHTPRGYTPGKVSFEPFKIKVYQDSALALRQFYASYSTNGTSFGNPQLNHRIQYIIDGFEAQNLLFEQAAWVSETETHDEGPDGMMVEIEFKIMKLYLNGLVPWDDEQV